MSEADVARALGVAPGTVKSHLHRAVEHLRRALGPSFDARFEEA
jgi:DNA-directed RNA polymerase specialized sigma24 family protein